MNSRALPRKPDLRLTLLCLLASFAAPVAADWVEHSETDDARHYHEPASVRRSAQFARVWTVRDMNQLTNYGAMSLRVLYELDCRDAQYRVLAIAAHPGRMGDGAPIRSAGEGEWQFVIPGTPVEDLLGIVCRGRGEAG